MELLPMVSAAAVCDFCSAMPVVKSYDAAPVRVELTKTIIHVVDSHWTACSECAHLIEAGLWGELTERSFQAWRASAESAGARIGADDLRNIREEMTRLHGGFRDALVKSIEP